MTEAQAREIRALWADGRLLRQEIAERYNVNESTIYNIVHYRTWTHVD